jgi:hypothetical protein
MATHCDYGDALDGGRGGGHCDEYGDKVSESCDTSNPVEGDVSLFPAAASPLPKVWKERPAESHRWTSSLGDVE